MNAEKYGLDRIYFGGCFIRGHAATIATLSYAIRFWSKGTKRALFLRHEGFLCVLVLLCLSNHPTYPTAFISSFSQPHSGRLSSHYSCTDFSWHIMTAVLSALGSRILMKSRPLRRPRLRTMHDEDGRPSNLHGRCIIVTVLIKK